MFTLLTFSPQLVTPSSAKVLTERSSKDWSFTFCYKFSIFLDQYSISFRFILIGSGNPEEGELRPQLLDRFGMHAQVGTVRDAELRVKIVEERARFDKNPKEFRETYKADQDKLQEQITAARSCLGAVSIDHELRVKISKVCAELNVDGLRGDIVTNRAAKALAALKGRDKVTSEDIATVIPNCLRHRLRKDPLESIDSGMLVIEKFYEVFS